MCLHITLLLHEQSIYIIYCFHSDYVNTLIKVFFYYINKKKVCQTGLLNFRSGILSIKKHVRLSCCNLVSWSWLHLVIITFKPDISGLVETEGYVVAPVNLTAEMGNDTDE